MAILPCPGYDAKTWMCMYTWFCAIYGLPHHIRTDHAISFQKAAMDLDWDTIKEETMKNGTTWTFTAKGFLW